MNTVGIDLGTTNTVACLEERILVMDRDGATKLPSVVAFLPNGQVASGVQANRRRALDPGNTIFSSKRLIGRRLSDPKTRQFRERYPFEVVDAGGDRPAFETRAGLHTPVDIAAMLLDGISQRLGNVSADVDVVLTVPIGFSEAQRDETYSAALQAGLRNVRLVDEASATAFAYRSDPDVNGTVAIYDLGGGTFDFVLFDCDAAMPRLLGHASDLFLGGDDIDCQIAKWATLEVLKMHNWDLNSYVDVATRLLGECERAKIRLASSAETEIDLSQVDPECPVALAGLPIGRAIVDRLCMDLVQRTFAVCDEALRQAGLRAGEVRAVVLAGGTTHLPMIRESVEAYFGRTALVNYEPTEVVAFGASQAPPV